MIFRDYQRQDFNKLVKAINEGNNHVLFSACTSWGKSSLIYNVVKHAIGNKRRTLIIAPRRKLVKQLSETLNELGDVSINMGTDTIYYRDSLIQVASLQTITARLKKDIHYLEKIDNILIDEVHIGMNQKAFLVLKEIFWESAIWVGLSGTPIDAKGYRLEGFDITVEGTPVSKLTSMGFLTPVKCYAPIKPDLSGIKITGGDYNEKQLAQEMADASIVSNAYEIFNKYAKDLKTMVFCVSIQHAEIVKEEFDKNNVPTAIVHSKRDEREEEKDLVRFRSGEVQVMINVGKLITGYDEPSIECLLMLRPTKSLPLYIQSVGRLLRIHPGKSIGLILDCAGNIKEHGYPTLDRDFNIKKPEGRVKEKAEEAPPAECPECGAVFDGNEVKRKTEETKHTITTTFYCPMCEEVLRETQVYKEKISELEEVVSPDEIKKQIKITKMTNLWNGKKQLDLIGKMAGYKKGWGFYTAKLIDEHDLWDFARQVFDRILGLGLKPYIGVKEIEDKIKDMI